MNNIGPAWFVPAFAVAPAGKKFTIWDGLDGLTDNCHYWKNGI